jgi:hypothetical protein
VARELAPAGLRSGPKILGALRTPAGARSLATGAVVLRVSGGICKQCFFDYVGNFPN